MPSLSTTSDISSPSNSRSLALLLMSLRDFFLSLFFLKPEEENELSRKRKSKKETSVDQCNIEGNLPNGKIHKDHVGHLSTVNGLYNLGNTCYFNSVIQCLSALSHLSYFLKIAPPSTSLIYQLGLLLESLRVPVSHSTALSPISLMRILNQKKNMINFDQQDAQELFQLVSSTISEELSKLTTHSPSLADAFCDISLPSVHHPPFTGTLSSRLACLHCGYTPPIRHFIFDTISLPLPTSKSSTHLLDLLNTFVELEYIDDATCRKCSILSTFNSWSKQAKAVVLQERKKKKKKKRKKKKESAPPNQKRGSNEQLHLHCLRALIQSQEYEKELPSGFPPLIKTQTRHTKQMMFSALPLILVIHLNRSTMYGAHPMKNGCEVTFPSLFDLTLYATSGFFSTSPTQSMASRSAPESCWYRLQAYVAHYGRHSFGHYVAYRRHPHLPDVWFRISDTDVQCVQEKEVFHQCGSAVYMLFYEKQTTPIQGA